MLDLLFRGHKKDRSRSATDHFLTARPELTGGRDVAVKRLTADAEFLAEVSNDRAAFAESRLRKAQLGRRHLRLPAAHAASGARGGKAGDRALADQFALEFGERREDAED